MMPLEDFDELLREFGTSLNCIVDYLRVIDDKMESILCELEGISGRAEKERHAQNARIIEEGR